MAAFCDPAGAQTQNLQNRNLTLYSIELRGHAQSAGLFSFYSQPAADLTFSVHDQRIVLHIKIRILMLRNQSHDRFVIKSSSPSTFAADKLHVRFRSGRIQFIFRHRLSVSPVIDLDDLRFHKEIERVIDRSGGDMLRFAGFFQLGSGEGLLQQASLRQHHFPHDGGSHIMRLDIGAEALQCGFI